MFSSGAAFIFDTMKCYEKGTDIMSIHRYAYLNFQRVTHNILKVVFPGGLEVCREATIGSE